MNVFPGRAAAWKRDGRDGEVQLEGEVRVEVGVGEEVRHERRSAADDNGKNEDPAKMTYSKPDFVSRNYSVSEEISRNIPRFEEKYERNK